MGASERGLLLALTPGLRQTGWAVLDGPAVIRSGAVGLNSRRKIDPGDRIAHQLDALSSVVARWPAVCAVRSKAGSINWRVPGLEQLDNALYAWADGLDIPLLGYTTQEVRAAVAGQPNASRETLCYAIMRRLGLIGQRRATPEWEAIAVGYYHLALRSEKREMSAGRANAF